MRVEYPLDNGDGAVTLGGETVPIDDDGTLECTEAQASTLARMYDVDLSDLRVDGGDEPSGTCETVKSDGDVCGRERPCPYHD